MDEQKFLLSKKSSPGELKQYFVAILELSKSDNEFPINLDEVWPLAYSRKDKAVASLKKNFIENEDFRSFPHLVEREYGGTTEIVYMLSVSCLEYFIARKKRSVFDVYRQVFHKTANLIAQPKLPTTKELALMVVRAEEEKERLALENKQLEEEKQQLAVENEVKTKQISLQQEQIKQSAPKVQYYEDVLMSQDTLTTEQVAKQIGMDAAKLNKKLEECGLLYKASGQWLLHSPYDKWNLHGTRTYSFTNAIGKKVIRLYTVFNSRGCRFIWALKENNWNIKQAINAIKGQKVS